MERKARAEEGRRSLRAVARLRKKGARVRRPVDRGSRAEAAPQGEEAYYRLLAENVSDVICTMDMELRFTYVSPSVTRFLGYTGEEARSRRLEEILTPASFQAAVRALSGELAAEERGTNDPLRTRTLELEHRRKDGSTVWAEVRVSFLRGDDGRPVGILAVSRDISERQQAARALGASEAHLRAIFEAARSVAFFITDRAGTDARILEFSPGAESIFGHEREEVMGRPVALLHLPEDVARFPATIEAFRRRKKGLTQQTTLVRKSGEKFPALLTLCPLFDGKGVLQSVLGVTVDLSGRKRAEQALEESEARYRGLFEDAPSSLREEDFSQVKAYLDRLRASGVQDLRTYLEAHPEAVAECARLVRILHVNKATVQLYQAKTKEELLGNLGRVFSQESYPAFLEELLSLAPGETVYETEAVTRTLPGEKKHVVVRCLLAPGCEDTWSRLLVAVVDASESRHLAKELLEAAEKERRRWGLRPLRGQRPPRFGQDLHDGLGQLLTGIALKCKLLEDRFARQCPGAAAAAREVKGLANEALGETRALARGLSLVSLEEEGLVSALAELAHSAERPFGVRCRFDPQAPVAIRDRETASHLYHIAQEAVSNAVKHGKARQVSIGLRAGDGRVVLRVWNDGAGIPEALGTQGSGLRIMRYRARMMGASLSVRTGVGGGTEVACSLRDRTTAEQ